MCLEVGVLEHFIPGGATDFPRGKICTCDWRVGGNYDLFLKFSKNFLGKLITGFSIYPC